MRKLLTLFLVISSVVAAKAQAGKQVALGFSLDIPFDTGVRDYTRPGMLYQDGLGASFTVETPITSRLHLQLSAGYMSCHSDVNNDKVILFLANTPGAPTAVNPYAIGDYVYRTVPVKATLKYYFLKILYIDGAAGAAIKDNVATSTSFIYSGGAGVAYPVGNVCTFGLGLDYGPAFRINGLNYQIKELGLHVNCQFRL
jgi:hypothetical protein